MGFCQWAEMGLKVGQKWVFGCKGGLKCVKTHFFSHFKPISAYSRKPTFLPVQGGAESVFQKGPAVPTQHKTHFLPLLLVLKHPCTASVETSTVKNDFPRKCQSIPTNYYQYFRWIQKGFAGEPLRNDSGANFQ